MSRGNFASPVICNFESSGEKMSTLSTYLLLSYHRRLPLRASPPSPLRRLEVSSVRTDENQETIRNQRPRRVIHTQEEARKQRSLLTTIFSSLDQFVCDVFDPPLRPSIDPKLVLTGNSAPVEELPPTDCEVESGYLPASLDGAYIRNGPNPQFIPKGPYHLFDGDGMLHCVRILNGEATFCSRYVKTYKYVVEREIGSPVVLNFFSAFTGFLSSAARGVITLGRALSGEYDLRRGIGGANTSLAHFGGRLFALQESDLPYTVRVTSGGDVITLGRHEAYGEPLLSMTAHPKVDGDSGEAFAYRNSIWQPFLTYFRINPDGEKQPEVPIFSLGQASLVHEMAITKNYAIFPDPQIVISPREILKGNPPAHVDPTKTPRLGIIPRYAADESEMRWVEVPGLNLIHVANAWEEDGGATVVIIAPNTVPVERALESTEPTLSLMERIEIDFTTGTVARRQLSTRCLDFTVINRNYVGKKTRYVYAAVSPFPKMTGVAKLDVSLSTPDSGDCTVAIRFYGPGCYGGEPFFVARDPDNPSAEEDEGFVVTYVFDEIHGESRFLVMDAKSPSLEIVASVKLPQRVPYGFHGIFLREDELQKLR